MSSGENKPVALWSVPRSISTAFERVFVERDDFEVLHEPLLVNARTFLKAVGFDPSLNLFVYLGILAVWAVALVLAITAVRRERELVLETETT